MATPVVSTPLKSHTGLFSTRTAGGRMPLSPSPCQQRPSPRSHSPSPRPRSPMQRQRSGPSDHVTPRKTSSIYSGNLFARPKAHRDSPKSNIACVVSTPRKALELGVSDFSLVGTGIRGKTPSSAKAKKGIVRQKTTKTTVSYSGDRFIPNRGASSAIANSGSGKLDFQEKQRPKSRSASHNDDATDDAIAALESLSLGDEEEPASYSRPSPNTVAFQDSLANACGVSLNARILQFKPAPPESSRPIDLRQQYNRPLKPATASATQFKRRVTTTPDRVLDAPDLLDDFYLNLLDWSSANEVAIGLGRSVYVWSAEKGSVSCLVECPADTYISSVKWSNDGVYLSVGLGTGEVQIWDVAEETKIRTMLGHDTRVSAMGWSKHLLSTGARSGLVFNHDVRVAEHKVAELVSHTAEVCGLEWRSDGAQLATGGNDNLVSIWDARSLAVPKFTKTNHTAAVKALAWCPWNMSLLATGGGTSDRHIHFWNTSSGARVNSIDTGSQVTSLRWAPHYREIASTAGAPVNSISIWSYPTLVRNVEIPAHESRILHSSLSPDGQTLATAAADENLKFWKIFEKKAGAGAGAAGAGSSAKAEMNKAMTIR